jgi:hypothetical protein
MELLKTKMDASNGVYNVYYIHCASGYNRTGMVSSTYLAYKSLTAGTSQYSVSSQIDNVFIYGTTLQRQESGGGNIVQKCDNIGTADLSTIKSRCFLASSTHNNTFLMALTNLVPPTGGITIA